MPRLGELYPGICLTTEEEAQKNLSQGSRRVLVYILPKRTRYKIHTYTPTPYKTHTYAPTLYKTHTYATTPYKTHTYAPTPYKPHTYTPTHYKTHTYTPTHYETHTSTHPHITKQFKTTTVQVKTNTVQDLRKLNSHNIIKYPQY